VGGGSVGDSAFSKQNNPHEGGRRGSHGTKKGGGVVHHEKGDTFSKSNSEDRGEREGTEAIEARPYLGTRVLINAGGETNNFVGEKEETIPGIKKGEKVGATGPEDGLGELRMLVFDSKKTKQPGLHKAKTLRNGETCLKEPKRLCQTAD